MDSSLFVVIKNIGFNKEKKIFEAFVKLFGEFYGAVEYTDIRIEPLCTGSDYEAIKLHNDDAIDLKNQPKTGFIQVINEDPLKSTRNGVVRIKSLFNKEWSSKNRRYCSLFRNLANFYLNSN